MNTRLPTFVLLLLAAVQTAPGAERWWREVPRQPLLVQDYRGGTPADWSTVGKQTIAQAANGEKALAAEEAVTVSVGKPDWTQYTAEFTVRPVVGPVPLKLSVYPAGDDPRHPVEANITFSRHDKEGNHLAIQSFGFDRQYNLVRFQKNMEYVFRPADKEVLKQLQAAGIEAQPWTGRTLHFKLEAGRQAIRLWMEGRSVLSVTDLSRQSGGFRLELAKGDLLGPVSVEGRIFLARISLGNVFPQDFQEYGDFLDVEVTKELKLAVRQPDPARFRHRPLGLPSSVHVFGMTFEQSPVQMRVTSDQIGHVANEPQAPAFRLYLEQYPHAVRRGLTFHEDAISGAHVMRPVDCVLDRSPYRLDESEQKHFDKLFADAQTAVDEVRHAGVKDFQILLGNGNPHLVEEFLRHKYPADRFDAAGNENCAFMRPTEFPPDNVSFNTIWIFRQVLDAYGYKDKPIDACYEWMCRATNPGNLSEDDQADYDVRDGLLALAWGFKHIGPGEICDVGNSYYYSNWGAGGFCHAKPEINPKPAYVAFATMTWMLGNTTRTASSTTRSRSPSWSSSCGRSRSMPPSSSSRPARRSTSRT